MHKAKSKTVIVVVGMPGAGKSLASSVAAKRRVPVFVSGDIIREEAKRRNLSPSKENLGRLMLKIREEEGMGAVAKRLAPLIEKIDGNIFVYEGARNIEEIEELNKKYRVFIIAIHASPESRYRRLLKRGRSDRPRNWADFRERDERELKVGVGKLIAIADRVVENEDTKNDLKRRTARLLKTLSN
jgi:dephospho-CoA kinase